VAENVIRASKDGPYLVTGPATLIDVDGNETKLDRKTVALCRCGGSQNKPFCDGTHSKTGFEAAEAAVRQAEAES
jgi:CDGSH-type Zn-finger protein